MKLFVLKPDPPPVMKFPMMLIFTFSYIFYIFSYNRLYYVDFDFHMNDSLYVAPPCSKHFRKSDYYCFFKKLNLRNSFTHIYSKISILCLTGLLLLLLVSMNLTRNMRYVAFDSSINMLRKHSKYNNNNWPYPLIIIIHFFIYVVAFDMWLIILIPKELIIFPRLKKPFFLCMLYCQ